MPDDGSKMRHNALAGALEQARRARYGAADAASVRLVVDALREWLDQSGWELDASRSQDLAVEVAIDLREHLGPHASEVDGQTAAKIAVRLLANGAAGRDVSDYGLGFLDQIEGIPATTRQRWLAEAAEDEPEGTRQQLGAAAARTCLRRMNYRAELHRRMKSGQSERAARRAMQRERAGA